MSEYGRVQIGVGPWMVIVRRCTRISPDSRRTCWPIQNFQVSNFGKLYRVVVACTAPIWPDGSCDPDPYKQTRRCLDIIAQALSEAVCGLDDIIRTRMFLADRGDAESVGRAHGDVFANIRPASTMVVAAGLLDPRWRVEIEAEACVA